MPEPHEHHWSKPVAGLLILLLVVMSGYILQPYFFKITVPDESTFVYEGLRVFQGDVPYRDFFDFILPGTFYAVAAVYKLFGVSLFWLRLLALAVVIGCAVLTLMMARAYLPGRWVAALAILLWVVNIPGAVEIQHHLLSAFWGLAGVYCLWNSLRPHTQARNWTLASGLLLGVTTLFTQSLGLFLAVALTVFLVLYRWQGAGRTLTGAVGQTLLQLVLPVFIPLGLVFAYFASKNALDDLWRSTFQWVAGGGYANTTSHWFLLDGATRLMSYSKVLLRDLDMTFFIFTTLAAGWLPVLGLLWAVEYAVRRLHPSGWKLAALELKDWRLALLLAAGLAFFAASFSYPNTRLVSTHGWIAYLLAFVGLYTVTRNRQAASRILGGLLIGWFALSAVTEAEKSAKLLASPRVISYGTVERELLSGWSEDAAMAYNQMIAFIRQTAPPGKTLFTYNHAPEIYLYADRDNPTRYQLIMALLDTPGQIAEVAGSLEQAQPPVIIYNQVDAVNFKHDLRFRNFRNFDYHLIPIEQVLARHYQLVAQVGNLLIFGLRYR